MSWREVELGSLFRIDHGFAFKGEYFGDVGDYIVLTPGNFHEQGGFRPRPGKDRRYSASFPERYLLTAGDLIVAMTEQGEGLLGSAALVPESDTYLHNQRIGLVRVDESRANKRFIYYLFNTPSVRDQIRNSSSGAKVRHTSPERMYRVRALVPAPAEQAKVAAVLASLDDLIATNQRRISLLECTAEEIYREWFVRMRFPGYGVSPLDKGLPTGWSSVPLGQLIAETKRSVKKGDISDHARYVGLEHLSRKSVALTMYGKPEAVESDKLAFIAGDILFSKIRPYLHKVALAHFDGICSTDTLVLRPKRSDFREFALFTVFSETFIEIANTASKGTKMPRADWHFLKQLRIPVPGDALLTRFSTMVKPMLDEIATLTQVNETLAMQRDALIPRLISGKLRVDALDIQFPPSMQQPPAEAAPREAIAR